MKENNVLADENENDINLSETISIQGIGGTTAKSIDPERLNDKALFDLTSVSECLTVSMHEYNIERNKKQSFDNRASLIITVLTAIIIAIHNKIPLKSVISMIDIPLTFSLLIQIITMVLVYVLLIVALIISIRIVSIRTLENFDIGIINSHFAKSAKIDSVSKMLEVYLNLTKIHRTKNEAISKKLASSQGIMIIAMLLTIVYLLLF